IYPIQQYFSVIQMNLTLIIPFAIANLSEMLISLERIQNFLVMDERDDLTVLPIAKGGSSPTTFARKDRDSTPEPSYIVPKKFSQKDESSGGLAAELVSRRVSVDAEYPIELSRINASWTGSKEYADLTLKNFSLRLRKGKLCAVIGPVGSGKSSLLQVILKELPTAAGNLNVKGKISYACQESWLFPATVRDNILFGLAYDSKKYLEFPYGDQSLVGERGVSLSGGQRARINLARAVYREADIYLLDDPLSAVDANVGRMLFEGCIKGYLRGRTCILVTHQIHYLKSADQIVILNEGAVESVGTYDELIKDGKEFSLLLQRQESKSEEVDPQKQVVEAEERAKGNLKFEVVVQYFKSVQSAFVVILALLVLVLTQAAATTADYWLNTEMDTLMGPLTTSQYLIIYGSVVLGIIIFAQVRIITFVTMAMRRVLNRFSKDMGAMDEFLPRSMLETVQMYLSMASILVLNAVALPWTLIPTAVLMIFFVFMLRWYLNAAQASPVFGMINSTISGLSTIRSSNSQGRLLANFDQAQNLHTSAFYTFLGGSTGFGLYLDGLCLVYLGVIMALFIVVDFSSVIPVGSVGLAVSQSMVLTMLLQMAARFTADFLGQMTAVERVLEYTKLPTEDNIDDGPTQPPKQWPSDGNIKFESVFMKYGPEDPPVLRDLNIDIQSGWKVGVVGRTGAGKSSLISALFRLYDIDGSIKIDGIDTKGIAKKDLRSKISIIPQEPVLFSATL
ncbi:ABC transporter family C protein ABCC2, partial [Operophtera brumata]